MYIVAIAWVYVVSMMAMTEHSVLNALITFTVYCVIPLGIVWFITIKIKRRFVQDRNSSKSEEKKELENEKS